MKLLTDPNIYNQPLSKYPLWYHGTTVGFAKNIKRGIKLNFANRHLINQTDTRSRIYHTYDYGPGFYVTQNISQAKQWAFRQGQVNANDINSHPALVTLNLSNFIQQSNILKFHNPNKAFERHVFYCRIIGKFYPEDLNKYSAVFGPVVDGTLGPNLARLRTNFFSNKLNIKEYFNKKYAQFNKLIKPKNFYPEMNQLCLIDYRSIKDYIEYSDINWEALS